MAHFLRGYILFLYEIYKQKPHTHLLKLLDLFAYRSALAFFLSKLYLVIIQRYKISIHSLKNDFTTPFLYFNLIDSIAIYLKPILLWARIRI